MRLPEGSVSATTRRWERRLHPRPLLPTPEGTIVCGNVLHSFSSLFRQDFRDEARRYAENCIRLRGARRSYPRLLIS